MRNLGFFDEDKIIGNSNVKDVRIAKNEIKKNGLRPYDGQLKHDITKWSSSKKNKKKRIEEYIEKMDKHNFLINM